MNTGFVFLKRNTIFKVHFDIKYFSQIIILSFSLVMCHSFKRCNFVFQFFYLFLFSNLINVVVLAGDDLFFVVHGRWWLQ